MKFDVFHFDISGSFFNDTQPSNIPFTSVTFEVFHFDISGNSSNERQLANINFTAEKYKLFLLERLDIWQLEYI